MNFDPHKIIKILKGLAKGNGKVILATELVTASNQIERILSAYDIKATFDCIIGPLENIGLKPENVRSDLAFNNSRVEMGFIIQNVPKELEKYGLKSNDRVVTAISHRYKQDELEKLLRGYFSSVKIYLSSNKNTALAICS